MLPSGTLPEGACWRALRPVSDARGVFTEIYRTEWIDGSPALQWNFTRSEAGVLRGVRVHPRHDDYLVVLDGSLLVGLRDLRRRSPSFGKTALFELDGSSPSLLGIPAGVAHGLYAPGRCLFVVGASRYYDPADEIACRWDDPDLGIPWAFSRATVSPSDGAASSVAEVTQLLDRTMERLD
ncbi:MAG TPA: dTDP-4-dehydrorhamnose 3,5-epimerase family protein [Thermoanaerobaculia bacterium]|nr:dTDP-4-dehydrorhamnose 3,5-epimerase family protein [Thermoanaerobaculia bacterium]